MIQFGHAGNPLAPLVAPGERSALLPSGADGMRYKNGREPSLCTLANGHVLFVWQGHESNTDQRCSTFFSKKSRDHMRSWDAPKCAFRDALFQQDVRWENAGALGQSASGRVHYIFTQSRNGITDGSGVHATANGDIYLMYLRSADNGDTFAAPVDISAAKPPGAGWCIAGKGPIIELTVGAYAGRLICPINYRTTPNTTGAARSGCIASDDDGDNWFFLTALDTGQAANDDTNECSIAECVDGSLYLGMRKVGSHGGDENFRWGAVAPDGNAVWGAAYKETSLPSSSCSGVVRRVGAELWYIHVGDSNLRANIMVAKSSAASAAGVSWTRKQLFPGPGGYSNLTPLASGRVGFAWEGSYNLPWSNTQNVSWYQYILQATVGADFFEDPTPPTVRFQLNEASSGAIPVLGTPLLPRGDLLTFGRGGATGAYTATGISQAGGGAAAILAFRNVDSVGTAGNLPSPLDPGSDSFTIRIKALRSTEPAPNFKALCGNRTTTSAGLRVSFNAAGQIQISVGDDSTTASLTTNSGVNFTDGVSRDVRIVVNRATGKLQAYVDGLLQTSQPNLPAGSIIGVTDWLIGAPSGIAAAWDLDDIDFTRGIVTDDVFPAKISPNVLTGFNPSTPASMPSLANCKLFLAPIFNGGRGNAVDLEGGYDTRNMPPKAGEAFWTCRELAQGRLFTPNQGSLNRGPNYRQSTGLGLLARPSYDAGAAGGFWRASPGTDYDFLQNTALFTLLMFFEYISDPGTTFLLDSMGNSNTAAGLQLNRASGTKLLQIKMGNGSASRIAETPVAASPTFEVGVSYGLAVRGNGPSQKLDFRRCTYVDQKISGAITGWQTVPSVDATNGAYPAAARPFVVGARGDDTGAANWMLTGPLLFDVALSNDAIDDWFRFMPQSASPIAVPQRAGIGAGVGA